MKKIITFILILLLSLQIVTAWGVTYPQPQEMQLLQGEEARFWVTIDAVQSGNDLQCKIVPMGNKNIELTFDQDEEVPLLIPKGTAKALYGTVKALENAEFDMHQIQFCPDCEEVIDKAEGVTGVQGKYCVPFKVEISDIRTRDNPQEQIPPKPVDYFWYYVGGGVIVLLILLLLIVYLLKNKTPVQKGKKTKAKKKKRK